MTDQEIRAKALECAIAFFSLQSSDERKDQIDGSTKQGLIRETPIVKTAKVFEHFIADSTVMLSKE